MELLQGSSAARKAPSTSVVTRASRLRCSLRRPKSQYVACSNDKDVARPGVSALPRRAARSSQVCICVGALLAVLCLRAGSHFSLAAVGDITVLSSPPVSLAGGAGSHPENPYYEVTFNGVAATTVYNHPIQKNQPGDEGAHGSNNLASFTMEKVKAGGYAPLRVEVRSKIYKPKWGREYHLRPTRYQALGIVTDIDDEQIARGMIAFTITAPCQLSVELGDDDVLFTETNAKLFTNLIIAANPPEEEWPKQKPSLLDPEDQPRRRRGRLLCKSAEEGRACLVPSTDTPCSEQLDVESGQDLYFTSATGMMYTWEDGCGERPKIIYLKSDARIFLDEGVIVHARVRSEDDDTGIYGYGIISNYHMRGVKNSKTQWGLITLLGRNPEIWGVTVAGSNYRNIAAGENGQVYWTKSFAWVSETDCVTMKAPGGRIFNNFFKVNDDCIKTFMPNSIFRDNIIWHQGIGRAILLNWGNLGINKYDVDGHTKVINTYIIHDEKGFKTVAPEADAIHTQARMMQYSFLIGALHSPNNMIGSPESPIFIKNVHLEGRVGSVLAFTNGYANLAAKAPWMGSNGCTGDVNVHIKGLDMSLVTGIAAPSVVGGCNTDETHPDIPNGDCICRSDMNCPVGRQCGISIKLEDVIEAPGEEKKLKDTIIVGANAQILGGDGEVIYA
mmetsp:Transcript_10422/g.23603  ORF Transcript_10422/g.23603 Transcript_10422/m.23603 type:complete len:672 (+) Transcript_10422:97-2112(+)